MSAQSNGSLGSCLLFLLLCFGVAFTGMCGKDCQGCAVDMIQPAIDAVRGDKPDAGQ